MHHVHANGANIPAIGFGTWTLKGETCARLVAGAIQSGYRHIDTAAMYENEGAVGDGTDRTSLRAASDDQFRQQHRETHRKGHH